MHLAITTGGHPRIFIVYVSGTSVIYTGRSIEQNSTVLKTAVTITVTPTEKNSSALNGGIITAITIPVVVVISLFLLLLMVVVGAVLKRKSKAEKFARYIRTHCTLNSIQFLTFVNDL